MKGGRILKYGIKEGRIPRKERRMPRMDERMEGGTSRMDTN